MRINVEFLGFPIVSAVVKEKRVDLDVPGNTPKDVMDQLIRIYGRKLKEAFYDEGGKLDPMIQIALNGKTLIPADQHLTPLSEGDTLTFMLLLPGG